MSSTIVTDLSTFSSALVDLVERTALGVTAVKAAPYRVVSGLAVGEDLVAVADHSLRREDRVPVHASDGSQGTGTILGRDSSVDLAILKVEGLRLKPLESADPTLLKPGALTVVVGLTTDVGATASLGILGAVGGSRRTWRGGTLDHFIRLDVNLYPSQSGAAVVDTAGNLIGLVTPALLRHSAVAVPLATVKRMTDELLREGRIRHGYLGIGLQPVVIPASLRDKIGIDTVGVSTEAGLMLLSVEPDSPADKAGLQLGDILVWLDGKPISDIDELQTSLRGDAVGRSIRAVLVRGGELIEAQIIVSERIKKAH